MTAPSPMKQLHIDALQSVMPATMTPAGNSRRVAVSGDLRPELLQSRLEIVLYYRRTCEGETARTVAAWMKESLSEALSGDPVLAGRLRREHDGDGYWEVKANDAGVRLVHATADLTVSEFLESEDRGRWEAQLAYWVDVNGQDPNFSALFCIQVTEFEGDGYSIGISCSLLLADPLFLTRFLKKWLLIHSRILSQRQLSKDPIFHLDYFKSHGTHMKSTSLDSAATTTTTVLFKAPASHRAADYGELASRCLEGSEVTVTEFSMMVSEQSGDLKVQSCCRKDGSGGKLDGGAIETGRWSELGVEEMVFWGGNKPVHVSYAVVSADGDRGLVVLMPPPDEESGPLVWVTAPQRN